jgi:hypothetical protein
MKRGAAPKGNGNPCLARKIHFYGRDNPYFCQVITTDGYSSHIVARLLEYWGWATPWHRRLWNTGSVAALYELIEAAEGIPPDPRKALQDEVARFVAQDVAVGDNQVRSSLTQLLKEDLSPGRHFWTKLKDLTPTIEAGYAARWAVAVRTTPAPRPERVARSLAGHLLHCGFSPTFLHRWLTWQAKGRTETLSIADLIEEFEHALIRRLNGQYDVVIPMLVIPDISAADIPPEWRTGSEIAQRLHAITGMKVSI